MRPPQRALLPRRVVKGDELYAAFDGESEGIRGAAVGGGVEDEAQWVVEKSMQREERAQDSVSFSRIPWKVGTYCEIWDCNTTQQWLYQHQYGVRLEGREEI